MSLPVREVWIEIITAVCTFYFAPSLPVREVWIEILSRLRMIWGRQSLPVREVWIEIPKSSSLTVLTIVTSREGSMK